MTSTTAPSAPPDAKTQEYEFEQMNLQVGGRIQFITHRTIKPMQHFSTVIGWVKDEYMIVKVPFENGGPIALNDGDKLTIRVFSGVNVCSFSCTVQRIVLRPLYYVHLSFPASIQGTSLRTAMRVKVDIPVQLSWPSGYVSVFLVNLSVSGALIEAPKKLPEDEPSVGLSFYLIAQPATGRCASIPTRRSATSMQSNQLRPTRRKCSLTACSSSILIRCTIRCCRI